MQFYFTTGRSDIGASIPDVPLLLPASSYLRNGRLRVPQVPEHISERAGDSGGYWFAKQATRYAFSIQNLADWYQAIGVTWGAMFDYPLHPFLGVPVRQRQIQTTLRVQHIWQNYRTQPFVWVPTVQGQTVSDYRRHACELAPTIQAMQQHYGAGFRVGVGSLCGRADRAEVRRIVAAVAYELPGVPLHLWGIKLAFFKARAVLHPQVVSADSAAWNGAFGSDHTRLRDERTRLGLSKRQYNGQVCLPRYQQKIAVALAQPKQYEMFFDEDAGGA